MPPPRADVAVVSEGRLLPTDLLARIEADGDLEGRDPRHYGLAEGDRVLDAAGRSWSRLRRAWIDLPDAGERPEDDPVSSEPRQRWLALLFDELGHTSQTVVGPWRFVSDGLRLRLVRDDLAWDRPAYLEFDLEAIFSLELEPEFSLLWVVAHRSRFDSPGVGDERECWLERWHRIVRAQHLEALEQLRDGLERAITVLGTGFLAHDDNDELRRRLESGQLDELGYFRQLLRFVYRLLLLFAAEDRDLLHDPNTDPAARDRYRHSHSTQRLRRLAAHGDDQRHDGLYARLQEVTRQLGSPQGGRELGLPPWGGDLFSPEATGDLDSLADEALLEAVRSLAVVDDGAAGRLVDYRDLDPEDFDQVCRPLRRKLPRLHLDERRFWLAPIEEGERTPIGDEAASALAVIQRLGEELEVELDQQALAAADPEAAILRLKVVDPACDGGRFVVAAASKIARRLASVRTGGLEPTTATARRTAVRDVIERCIYAVDVDPLAVELTKVLLWMEGLEAGKPLPYLDHHLKVGNSLIGATPALLERGIPDEAFEPIHGDDRKLAKSLRKRNHAQRHHPSSSSAVPATIRDARAVAGELDEIDGRTVEGTRRKAELHARLEASPELVHARRVADAWCAAFVFPKSSTAPTAITDTLFRRLLVDADAMPDATRSMVEQLADQYRFLHWHLAFPEVFGEPDDRGAVDHDTGLAGGFDLVVHNPPWGHTGHLDEEWFTMRCPEIAGLTGARRKAAIARLEQDDPALHAQYHRVLRQAEGLSHFIHGSGRFPLFGQYYCNLYAVFGELARTIRKPDRIDSRRSSPAWTRNLMTSPG